MKKTYNPNEIEPSCYRQWEENDYFKPHASKAEKAEAYSIILPPPNVTGTLHMGHGFQDTLMDALIRYHRMRGDETLWQAGTDHAGIATQMVVERKLQKEGIRRHDLGREKFIERVWQQTKESQKIITGQMRRLGASLDWSRSCFTLDPHICEAVIKVFVELYEEGIIYRGKRLVNWDPKFQTAISDLEVLHKDEKRTLWHIRYPIVGEKTMLTVATQRPETLFGDTAVAVHPDDERYKHLIGKEVALPLTDRTIPIIADEYVDAEFGSGVVKITPAHDFNDYLVGKRHDLPIINVLTPDAHMNENVPEAYQGLSREEAQKASLKALYDLNLIEKEQEHNTQIPYGDRSGVVIEPYLTDQWYLKSSVLAGDAIKAVKNKDIELVPNNWEKTYFQWLDNIEDWCISRQLWWGHRIPAWYDEDNKIYVGKDEADVRKKHGLADHVTLRQDEDVLDTWFSSALWAFAPLGWPEKTKELDTFFPTSVLVTGFDIIFFWVARMIMMSLKFTGKVPFKKVYITGLIRDHEGQKMSKSKGNVLDPLDLIDGIALDDLVEKRTSTLMQEHLKKKVEKNTRKEYPDGIPAFGTDAVRFTYAALASTGRDIRFDLGRVEGNRNFCNKIWNAARYVLMTLENQQEKGISFSGTAKFSTIDHWIIGKLHQTIENVHEHFESFRFDLVAQDIYAFIWNEYCDWYLELSKPVLQKSENEDEIRGTCQTLISVLETAMRLAHPFMPFITETIWQKLKSYTGAKTESIMISAYPESDSTQIKTEALEQIEWLKQIVLGLRNIRGEINISPSKPLPLILSQGNGVDKKRFETMQTFIQTLCKLENISWHDGKKELPASAIARVDQLELHVPMAGLIDKDAELTRLNKIIEKAEKELKRTRTKLDNPNYTDKAPADVVAKEREKLRELEDELAHTQQQFARLEEL